MQAREMTAEQATSFERTSEQNAALLKRQLKCGCMPYRDCYTYGRWQAQGYQVQRGQHGFRLPLVKLVQDDDDDETKTRRILGTSVVFCRCQVQSKNGNGKHPAETPTAAPVVRTFTDPDGGIYRQKPQPKADPVMAGWKVV